jgi:hypothetical protein
MIFGAALVWANDDLLVQETFLIQTFQEYAALNVCRFTWGLSLVGAVITPRGMAKVVMLWITTGLAKASEVLFVTRALWIGVRLLNAPQHENGGVGDSINAPIRILWEPLLAGSCEALVAVYGKCLSKFRDPLGASTNEDCLYGGEYDFGPKVLLLDGCSGLISWIEPYLLNITILNQATFQRWKFSMADLLQGGNNGAKSITMMWTKIYGHRYLYIELNG